ncbi:MAG: bifunctional tetrahydrofolate synthase/dihydrofolate synthase [Gammaproteobacteria bacterium]
MIKTNHLTLTQWLDYLEQCHPSTIDLGLERVSIVAKVLKLSPFPIPAIIVGGTNGKGSSVALLETIFSKAGYRVGTYTSPHLFRYNERVRVLQNEVDDKTLCSAFSEIEKARQETSLTYFEFGTLAALQIFKNADLDLVILEVGMGGRLDAVNIIDPEICIVTNVDLDHMEWLGNTRDAIAIEKAGIMRTNKPTIYGDVNPTKTFIMEAEKKLVPLFVLGQDFFYQENLGDWEWWNHQKKLTSLPKPKIALKNAATVIQTLEKIHEKFPVTEEAILEGLKSVSVYGRQTSLKKEGIHILLDVAHNPHGVSLLADTLSKNKISGKTYAVFSMLKDKDITAAVKCIMPFIDHWYLGHIQNERGCSLENMQSVFTNLNLENHSGFETVREAFTNASAVAKAGDRIIVFGSFHTVSEVHGAL